MEINPQAQELNEILKRQNPVIYELLSEKGKAIFFPKTGILSQSAEAKGKRINATIGVALDDDGNPLCLNEIASRIQLNPKDVFLYAPSYGKPELRKIWLEQIKKKNPSLKERTSLPVVTNALTHGLSVAGYLFVNLGDKIILTDKFWGNYKLIFENAYGGKLDSFNTFKDGKFDLESFQEKVKQSRKKCIILLNFPNNPTGYTPTIEEVPKIIKIIKEAAEEGKKVLVICDDAYFGLVYEPEIYAESLFAQLAELHPNVLAVKIDGATKEDYVWGLRVGFITYACQGITAESCAALEAKTAGTIRGNISSAPHLSQSLVLKALEAENYEKEKQEKYSLLKEKYAEVKKVLEEGKFAEYFAALPFNSGYFMCVQLKEELDGEIIRKKLLEQEIGIIALGNILRIAYSSVAKKNLRELFERIGKVCREIKKC